MLVLFIGSGNLVWPDMKQRRTAMKYLRSHLKLVWDIDKFRSQINNIDIILSPLRLPPGQCDAIVEEQDTDLLLDDKQEIRDVGDKPAWYLANKLESGPQLLPGQIIIHEKSPLRIQAVIHDLDAEPSCNTQWIEQAVEKILALAKSRNIRTLQLPLLGTRYSRVTQRQFLEILLTIIIRQQTSSINGIWLVTPDENSQLVHDELSELISAATNPG